MCKINCSGGCPDCDPESHAAAKKRVKYQVGSLRFFGEGSAFLVPVDHPDSVNVTNGELVRTSPVVEYNEVTGILETLNTVYEPATA